MKHLYSLLFIALCFSACAPKPIARLNYPKPFEFEMIDTLNKDKDAIYVKAHEWISKTYGSAKTVIDMQDKEAGKLIGKAIIAVPRSIYFMGSTVHYEEYVDYIITIDVKEGRYRVVLSDFVHHGGKYGNNQKTSTSESFGSLSKETVYYTSLAASKPVANQNFYAVKNQAMEYSERLMREMKEKMHKPEKDF